MSKLYKQLSEEQKEKIRVRQRMYNKSNQWDFVEQPKSESFKSNQFENFGYGKNK